MTTRIVTKNLVTRATVRESRSAIPGRGLYVAFSREFMDALFSEGTINLALRSTWAERRTEGALPQFPNFVRDAKSWWLALS